MINEGDIVPLLSASGRFQSPPPISETVSLHISHQHRRSLFSGCAIAPLLTYNTITLRVYILLWT